MPIPHRHNNAHLVTTLADCEVSLGNSDISAKLSNDRALFIPSLKALIIADVHIGKAMHFRRSGIAIPAKVMETDLARLARLIDHYHAQSVIIAGDFFHDDYNAEFEQFFEWQHDYLDVDFTLVKGNHDRLPDVVYERFNITVQASEYSIGQILISHFPLEKIEYKENQEHDTFTVCGHIHPGVEIAIKKRQKIKLPCFLMDEYQLILPAFSLFTGLNTVFQTGYPSNNLSSFAVTQTAIFEV